MKSSIRNAKRHPVPSADNVHVVLAGYRLLRLDPGQWRMAVTRLTAPLTRLGRLKRVQARAWQAAIGERDCGGQKQVDNAGGELCA